MPCCDSCAKGKKCESSNIMSDRKNTRRENELEELGRVDAERGHTHMGRKNLAEEKARLIHEMNERVRNRRYG